MTVLIFLLARFCHLFNLAITHKCCKRMMLIYHFLLYIFTSRIHLLARDQEFAIEHQLFMSKVMIMNHEGILEDADDYDLGGGVRA